MQHLILTTTQTWQIWGICAATFAVFLIYFQLAPHNVYGKSKKTSDPENQSAPDETTPLKPSGDEEHHDIVLTGVVSGDYSAPWTQTFDLWFLIFMLVTLATLVGSTIMYVPELWTNKTFWMYQLPKPVVMVSVSVCMGLICRVFCTVDEMGYIQTKHSSWFKVNYTRKVQHFCAYFVPIMITVPDYCGCSGTIETAWGQWMTLFCFFIMIKPLREMPFIGKFFMLQFNSMDRPEDRPNTLEWIVAYNIIPGTIMINIFRYMFSFYKMEALAMIFVLVTGLGDGLAEPVGIYFGKHQYLVSGKIPGKKYTRSLEGSACVYMSAIIFTGMFATTFANATQFWVCFWLMGPAMALAEAYSPHTMDTPFMMGLGGLIIYGCITLL